VGKEIAASSVRMFGKAARTEQFNVGLRLPELAVSASFDARPPG
jgi:hypothetical protein